MKYEYRILVSTRRWSGVLMEWQSWSDWRIYRGFKTGKEIFSEKGVKQALRQASREDTSTQTRTLVQRRPVTDDWENVEL